MPRLLFYSLEITDCPCSLTSHYSGDVCFGFDCGDESRLPSTVDVTPCNYYLISKQ